MQIIFFFFLSTNTSNKQCCYKERNMMSNLVKFYIHLKEFSVLEEKAKLKLSWKKYPRNMKNPFLAHRKNEQTSITCRPKKCKLEGFIYFSFNFLTKSVCQTHTKKNIFRFSGCNSNVQMIHSCLLDKYFHLSSTEKSWSKFSRSLNSSLTLFWAFFLHSKSNTKI